jgi:ATP-dependent RNA helicase DeaD
VKQVFYQVPFRHKQESLCRVLDAKRPERAIVFCATKRMVDEVTEGLQARGYLAEGLHGDMSQAIREATLRSFRDGRIEVLVATDVAARGLDIPAVSHVVNFDIPPDPEYYVHRIGRTGRLGRGGEAITFVGPAELYQLKNIERATGARIAREEVPTVVATEERARELLEEQLLSALAEGRWGPYRAVVEELVDDYDPIDVAAAALSLAASRPPARPARPRSRTIS